MRHVNDRLRRIALAGLGLAAGALLGCGAPQARRCACPAPTPAARALELVPAHELDGTARAVLPPALPWSGRSRGLAVAADHAWVTPAEASGLRRTPGYAETLAYLQRLADASPEVELLTIGTSGEGRPLVMAVVSADRAFTAEALRAAGKPVLLVQGGLHAGEIDGKDAGLMLLRDLTVRPVRRALLARASLLFIPVLNPDGHERASAFSRSNQRGPEEMGWRSNARNLNLNRDFSKLQSPEARAVVGVLNTWQPDLWIDVHVTDGVDYQYDVTFGFNGAHGHSPRIAGWLGETLAPALNRALSAQGHQPGPLIFAEDDVDPRQGLVEWTATPRYAQGYADARHSAALLIENHSLKPFDRRVLGTYVALAEALETLGRTAEPLRAAAAADRRSRRPRIPLGWDVDYARKELIAFAGVALERKPSPISGAQQVRWLGRPQDARVPYYRQDKVTAWAARPRAYVVPAAWTEVIAGLQQHGITVEPLAEARELDVAQYRIAEHALDPTPYEGRVRVAVKQLLTERRRVRFAPGSVRVPTDQPLGDLAVLLLEPACRDSYFGWGFMLEVLQAGEYIEGYVIGPMAERMRARRPDLARAFARRLRSDPAFAADPQARLQWFYRRTRYADPRHLLYPIARE